MPLGAAGKRVRLVAVERRKRGFGGAEAARSVGKVAIGIEHLAEVWSDYIRLCFALSRGKYSLCIRLLGWSRGQPRLWKLAQADGLLRGGRDPILGQEAS